MRGVYWSPPAGKPSDWPAWLASWPKINHFPELSFCLKYTTIVPITWNTTVHIKQCDVDPDSDPWEVTNCRIFAENAQRSAENMQKKFNNFYNNFLFIWKNQICTVKTLKQILYFQVIFVWHLLPGSGSASGSVRRPKRRQNPDPNYNRCLSTSLV